MHFFPFTFLQPYLFCSSTPVDYLSRSDNEFATHFTRPTLLGELVYLKNAKKWKHILATKHFKLHYLSNNRNLSSLTQKYNEIMLTQLMYITIHLWLFRVILPIVRESKVRLLRVTLPEADLQKDRVGMWAIFAGQGVGRDNTSIIWHLFRIHTVKLGP